jgi:hypothetical protein
MKSTPVPHPTRQQRDRNGEAQNDDNNDVDDDNGATARNSDELDAANVAGEKRSADVRGGTDVDEVLGGVDKIVVDEKVEIFVPLPGVNIIKLIKTDFRNKLECLSLAKFASLF